MLRTDQLPEFIFVADNGSETRVPFSRTAPRIRSLGDHLRAKVPAGSVVGLMFPTGPALIVTWLACLHAGLRPLIMQYPTQKQSRTYWADSVRNTVTVTQLGAVIADAYSCSLGLADIVVTISEDELSALPDGDAMPLVIPEFSIVQLSSGTTGHRKAVEFTAADLVRHARDYNDILGLTASDRVVSWLPLYHDMGYVACFVMPLLLGIPVVMMDPMTWVRTPQLLFETIDRHAGTICYQPNFGYELMARCVPRQLPSMRWWISCSEPISAETSRRFIERVGADPESFAPCYAMAENIFALSIRRGIVTRRIDGVEVVSCGEAIPHVSLKVVEGEIWARSPTSLRSYLGGTDIRDEDGFYPTGDLGEIAGGEIFVTGRKQDLLIQAGRKFMLSDIDLALNALYPEVRGRAATIALYDERLGTQQPILLIEAPDFFTRVNQQEIAEAMKSSVGLDQIEVHFVPPRFLTKTSSGKINRKKSGEDWGLHRAAVERGSPTRHDAVAEIRGSFPGVEWTLPVKEALDSLSLTVLRVILGDAALPFDSGMSLNAIVAALAARRRDAPSAVATTPDVIRIVSLADKRILAQVTEAHLEALGRRLGAPVTLEHVCLPPAAVLLSDLIFHDWFQPRLDQDDFAGVDRAMAQLRGASLILTDDVAELFFPPKQIYGVLSHAMERDPRADLVAVRWQRYPQHHHKLPMTVVAGQDIPLFESGPSIERLAAYLGTPIFRIATIAGFASFTQGWEYRPLQGTTGNSGGLGVLEPDAFIESLAFWAEALPAPLARKTARGDLVLEMAELAHFCSHMAPREAVDLVLDAYDSFCIVGQDASIPYVRRALDQMGKRYVQSLSYAPQALAGIDADYDCVLVCGAQGNFPLTKPTFALMRATGHWWTLNVTDPALAELSFSHALSRMPESGKDWYHPFDMDRRSTARAYVAVRIKATREVVKRTEAARAERLARRAARGLSTRQRRG